MRCNMTWRRTDFQCLFVEENSILLVCTVKVHLLKLQDADHKQGADEPNPTRPHMRHVRQISRPRKKLRVLGRTEVLNSLCNMWACIILLKDSSRAALKDGNDIELLCTSRDVPVAIEINLNS
ncbi:hypothetical protein TNCV_2908181 [Trichonephila clavipes]|nr:hypothetical protein TNCV_2908181 [Trichonephila clavipes]